MRRSWVLCFVFSLLALPLFAQQPAPRGELADRIIAVVGDSIILKSEIDLDLQQMKASGQPIPDSARAVKGLLDRRIGELVLLQAAVRDTSLKLNEEQINADVQKELDARRRQFGSEAQFQAALTQAGMTLDELRRNINQEMRSRELLKAFIGKTARDHKPPPVSDADIRKYYEENKASFGQRPATVTFTQVVIAPRASDSARAAAHRKAEEALQKLREGADFETVAKQYSEDPTTREKGGDLGWFRPGNMVREFEDVAFALRPGEVSGIVETPFGFHIIKVEKVKGAERQARHILIIPTVTPEDAERMRTYANDIAEKVRAGASMDSLIKAVGDPNEQSHVGPYPKDRLPAAYASALADVSAGSVIGPLELPGATGASKFAIVKVTDTRPAGDYSLDDPQFRADLKQTLEQNTVVDELIRDLKKRTLVEYRLEQ